MKKLCSPNKGAKRVHPSPHLPPPALSALPTALLALASVLSAEEQEVLAYLLGCCCSDKKDRGKPQRKGSKNKDNHPPELGCSCFGCYKSFWARWDSSPNRHVIHAIIDAFEETPAAPAEPTKPKNPSRRKRNAKKRGDVANSLVQEAAQAVERADAHVHHDDGYDGHDDGDDDDDGEEIEEGEEGKSSMRMFVSWVFGIND